LTARAVAIEDRNTCRRVATGKIMKSIPGIPFLRSLHPRLSNSVASRLSIVRSIIVVAKFAGVSALAYPENLGDVRYGQIGQLLIERPLIAMR